MKNIEKMAPSTCYCSRSGDTSLNMLECVKCKRWFHEECVKCLNLPMLLGDRFFIFVCSVCNAGSEYLARLEMTWPEIAHLLLYNLTILEKKKYYHLDNVIIPYLQDNWERFHLFGPIATEEKNFRVKFLEAFQDTTRFKCGKEIKKCKNIYGLRKRVPTEAPCVVSTAARLKKDVVVWDFVVKDRSYCILPPKKSTKNKENCKNGKHKSKLTFSSSVRQKKEEVSKCRGSVPHSENGIHKAKHKNKRTTTTFNEESASYGLLDSLIPIPTNFSNCNNPFLNKSCKSSTLKRSISHTDKIPECKRQKTGNGFLSNVTVSNGNHPNSDDNFAESTLFFNTKEDITQGLKNTDFCIIGKRTTASGKVQYLLQKNR